jgi:hypothetical protein
MNSRGYYALYNSFIITPNSNAYKNSTSGYTLVAGSMMRARLARSFNNTLNGFDAGSGCTLYADYSRAESNGQNGYYIDANSYLFGQNSSAVNNTIQGYHVEKQSSAVLISASATGNISVGIEATFGSYIYAYLATATGSNKGIQALEGSHIDAPFSNSNTNSLYDYHAFHSSKINTNGRAGTPLCLPIENNEGESDSLIYSSMDPKDIWYADSMWMKYVSDVLIDPPVSPSVGERYLIDTTASGDWIGHENSIAEWNSIAWIYTAPAIGLWVYNISEPESFYVCDGSAWTKKDFYEDQAATLNQGGGTRPGSPVLYQCFFDTALVTPRPIWWDGVNWVDATGTAV